jgi:transposase
MTWLPKKLTRSQMAERRAEGVRMLKAGKISQVQIAQDLGVSEAAVSTWKKRLDENCSQALELRKATGRPPKLNQEAREQLADKLKQGAIAAGFPTEQWTQARVKKVIEQEFGVVYHQNYVSRLLGDMGWSVQKPDPRAIERDEELILAWIKQDWPRIKKGSAARRRNSV